MIASSRFHRTFQPRSFLTTASMAALLLGLSACDLGPDYKRPAMATPGQFTAAPDMAALWPSADWWKGFGSPELDALEDQARKANFDLAAAMAQVREADGLVKVAGAPLLPAVDLTGDAQHQRSVSNGGGGGSGDNARVRTDYTLAATASYELDFWGKNRAALEAARQTAQASRYNAQVVAITVVTGVAKTYFQIAALKDQIAIAQNNYEAADTVLRAVTAEQAAGTATMLDVVQQQSVVKNLKAVIPPLQSQLTQNMSALAILLGRAPEGLTIAPPTLASLAPPHVAPGLPSALLQRRPDVAQAEAQLISANASLKEARAKLFPDLTLTAEGGLESSALHSLFNPASFIYDLEASLTQPIFEGGALRGGIENAKARYDELAADYQKTVVSAFADVENGLTSVSKTAEQLSDQQDATATSRQAFQISQAQFQAGTINLQTVLNTEATEFQAENALAQDRLAYLQATVNLIQALGGGWQNTTVKPAS
ncbi:MAG TPA: efflux transporter outer membrane subunit [Stellaceae bacterium]|nr:efflux transporter outer membrane subunit [Stellaceae bacterium]